MSYSAIRSLKWLIIFKRLFLYDFSVHSAAPRNISLICFILVASRYSNLELMTEGLRWNKKKSSHFLENPHLITIEEIAKGLKDIPFSGNYHVRTKFYRSIEPVSDKGNNQKVFCLLS